MPIDRRLAATAVLLPALLAGCAADNYSMASAQPGNWGEANRQTMAAQVIDPAPEYAADAINDGALASAAIDRVHSDKIKKPERVRTSEVQTSGGTN
jgi:hypothetical protein